MFQQRHLNVIHFNLLVDLIKLEPDHNVSVKTVCECDIRKLELMLKKHYPNVFTNMTYFLKKVNV